MKKLIAIILAILYLFIYSGDNKKSQAPEKAESIINGICTYVSDGDTLKLKSNDKIYKVRLNGIDAPEKDQTYGRDAQKLLMRLCYKKNIDVYSYGQDKYGRVLGNVVSGGVDVNAEMIRQGAAWHYKRYSKDQKLADLENVARLERLGLWNSGAEPMPPWEYRKRKKDK